MDLSRVKNEGKNDILRRLCVVSAGTDIVHGLSISSYCAVFCIELSCYLTHQMEILPHPTPATSDRATRLDTSAQMSEYVSGTSVLAYKSSKHHAYVLSDTSGGRYSEKFELKSLLLVLDTLSSHLNLKRMTCN